MWYKALVAKHQVEGGWVRRGGYMMFVWWKDLCDIVEGKGNFIVGCGVG